MNDESIAGGAVLGDAPFQLLPEDGSPIALAVARAALSEQPDEDIDENRLQAQIFADTRIQFLPATKEIRRNLAGTKLAPASEIRNEREIEPWFERYLWQHRTAFDDPSPMTLNTVVENTARIHGPPGRWTRPDLCMGCVARYRYTPQPQFDLSRSS